MSAPLTIRSERRCGAKPGEERRAEEGAQPEREEIAEVQATLDREDRRQGERGRRDERDPGIRGELAGEEVGPDDCERGAEHDRGRRGAEHDVAGEEQQRPPERVLREVHAVADAAEPRLEEERHAAAAREDLSLPQCVDLPQVDRLVPVPRVSGEDLGVYDDRDRARHEHDGEECPIEPCAASAQGSRSWRRCGPRVESTECDLRD